MSLQITSGGGGTVALQGVGTAATTTASGTSGPVVPSYFVDFAGLSRATSLGLSQPSSVGDLEVLFARISTALRESLDTLTTVEDQVKAETFRGQIGTAMAAFDQMRRWGEALDINRENIKVQTAIEKAQIKVRDDAQDLKAQLESSRKPKQDQLDANRGTIQSLNTQIGDLQSESTRISGERIPLANQRQALLNELFGNPPPNAGRIGQINASLVTLNTAIQAIDTRLQQIPRDIQSRLDSIQSLTETNATLIKELEELDGRIAAARREAETAQTKIDAAQSSRKASEEQVARLEGSMEAFVLATIPLAIVALGQTRSDMGRDAAAFAVEGNSFEALLATMARALNEIGAALTDTQVGADVALNTSGAGLNQTQSTPDRFGQLSAPVARAIAFAGMVAGVLGAVADLLNGLGRGMGMQTAGAMAGAGEPRVRVGL